MASAPPHVDLSQEVALVAALLETRIGRLALVRSSEILVAFSLPDSRPLGNIWRITAKKTDFYVDPLGQASAFHLSALGPNEGNPGHRFHVRVDRKAASAVEAKGT
jgi:hypothetical protein